MWSILLVFCDCVFHSVYPLIRIRIRSLWKLPDGRDWLWEKLGLVLMAGPCSVNFYSNFLLMNRVVFPPCCLAWVSAGDSWTLTGKSDQSLVGTLLLSPGSWCTQGFFCARQESVSPGLWTFCDQIPLASRVKFPGSSPSLCQIPRLENLLWVLEIS